MRRSRLAPHRQRLVREPASNGSYQLWLNRGFNPLQLIAAKDGYQPVSKVVTITKGTTTSANFALTKS